MTQAVFLERHEQVEDLLVSTYPLTADIVSRIEASCNFRGARTMCIAELKRHSILGIIEALRKICPRRIWVVVSDQNYQPYLPILILLAAFTRADKIRLVDFAGSGRSISRVQAFLLEPLKLIAGSASGAISIIRMYCRTERFLRSKPIELAATPAHPQVAYLKTNLWFGVQAGGSIGHVAGVVNGFQRTGSPVTVFSAEALPMLDTSVRIQKIRGRNVSALPLEVNGLVFNDSFESQVSTHIRSHPLDVIYQRNCLANCAGVSVSRRFRLPLILEYNGSEVWIARNWGTRLRFGSLALRVEKANLKHAHAIVVVSEVLRQELLGRGIPENKIVYYPNCVDSTIFDPAKYDAEAVACVRRKWDISSAATVCTFLGTFGPWHGVDLLARAVKQLAESRPSWLSENRVHFLFVGDGQLMPQVRAILAGVPDELITLVGLIPQHEAPLYLAASDIVLSPHVPNSDGSRFFGSPTKLFEYMAMSKAIIASELEQIGEILAGSWNVRKGAPQEIQQLVGSTAILVEPGSIEHLIRALACLSENPLFRKSLGLEARKRVMERYTWQQHVRQIMTRIPSASMPSDI